MTPSPPSPRWELVHVPTPQSCWAPCCLQSLVLLILCYSLNIHIFLGSRLKLLEEGRDYKL